jgi:phospholipid/cholesterol/gamma-HCH transport system substrate-binding protein
MPILKLSFRERSPIPLAIAFVVAILVFVAVGLNAGTIYRGLAYNFYTAEFSEAGGLSVGDKVRLGGVEVGKVEDIELKDSRLVDITISMEDAGRLGTSTRAAIKTDTPLGTKNVTVTPDGPGQLENGAFIPLERTTSPYDVNSVLSTLTRTTQQLNVPQLATSLNTISETLKNTPPELRTALQGASRIGETIASRDDALRTLLDNANQTTGILAERSGQITTLIGDGNLLLSELYQRRTVIHDLLVNVTGALNQLNGLVDDNNAQIAPALKQLQGVVDLLRQNDKNLASIVEGFKTYGGSLGEAVAQGPWFYGFVPNLLPSTFAQTNLQAAQDLLNQGGLQKQPGPVGAPATAGAGGGTR